MRHNVKLQTQSEETEKQPGHKPLVQSHEPETANLANLTQTGIQHLSPAAVVRLSRKIGNRAMAHLMAQRHISYPEVQRDAEEVESPRIQRDEGDDDQGGNDDQEESVPGPRTKALRGAVVQERGATGLRSSLGQRGTRVSGLAASIGDAVNLDGEGCYGWDRAIVAADVSAVVDGVLKNQSSASTTGPRIVIFSGHHGSEKGNLVGPVPQFLAEDQATAAAATSNNPGSQIEVIDDPSTYSTKASMLPAFTSTGYIRILAWCFSKRSYNNQATLKANWWPEPDHINAKP
jgi:hypothetical protein